MDKDYKPQNIETDIQKLWEKTNAFKTDLKNSKDKLLRLIGITDLEILSFKNNIIRYQANIMGNINSLNRDIENSSFFIIDDSKISNQLNLVYIK